MAMSNMPAVESDLGKAKTANTPLLAMREIFTKTGPPQGGQHHGSQTNAAMDEPKKAKLPVAAARS